MGTLYTTLEDLEIRLDRAVEEGIIDEHEAFEEYQDALRAEQMNIYGGNR